MKRIFNMLITLLCGFYLTACAVTSNNLAPVETRLIAQAQTQVPTEHYADSDKINQIAASYRPPIDLSVMDKQIHTPEVIPPNTADYDPPAGEIKCMALAMYHEARGEGEKGMTAVGYVIMNRTADERFPDTICGVTNQGEKRNGKYIPGKCQFSYMCDGLSEKPKNLELYDQITVLAMKIIKGQIFNPIGKSLYFHSRYVKTAWSKRFAYVKRIGNHIFYA